jgi:hypothetical protein
MKMVEELLGSTREHVTNTTPVYLWVIMYIVVRRFIIFYVLLIPQR